MDNEQAPIPPQINQPTESPIPDSHTQQPQAYTPQPEAQPLQQRPAVSENPGQMFGIISIILSFLGLSLVGLILGIISRKKSKEAGYSTAIGTIGIWLASIFMVLSLLIVVAMVALAFTGFAAQSETNTPRGLEPNSASSFSREL